MPAPYGLLGGLSYAVESLYGTDPTTGYTYVHPISSTLFKKRPVIYPDRIAFATSTTKPYGVPFVEGEVVQQFSFTDARVGKVLGNIGKKTGATYTIGGAGFPFTNNSLSIRENFGIQTLPSTYYEVVHTGCKCTALKIECTANKAATMTATFQGQNTTVVSGPTTPTAPADSEISFPSDFGTITIGGTAFAVQSFALNFEMPMTTTQRDLLGTTLRREPAPNGSLKCTGSIVCELANDTGFNSILQVANYLAGTPLMGQLVLGTNITAVNGIYTSATPALGAGPANFALDFDFDFALITTA